MNEHQDMGAAKEVAGKLRQATGKILGIKKQRARGLFTTMDGKAQKTDGDANDALKAARGKR